MNFKKQNNQMFKILLSLVIGMMVLPMPATQAAKNTSSLIQGESVRIFFGPTNPTLPPDTTLSLMLDTYSNQIAFVRIDLTFDPSKIQLSGEIQTTDLRWTVIQKTTKVSANSTGQISIILGLAPSNSAPTGVLEIAQIPIHAVTALTEYTSIAVVEQKVEIVDKNAIDLPFVSEPAGISLNCSSSSVAVYIGGLFVRSYCLPSGQSISNRLAINGGPVHVESTNGMPIFTSQRAIFGSSFNSIVGYPANQLTTDYWFTSYDDLGMITYLVIGNPSTSQTAQVDVYIGGNKMNATPYSITPGGRIFPRYGVNGGPVFVDGLNGVNVFASERTKFGNSFNEIMGYPANRLTTDYWFTSYDDVGMITYLVIGNPSTSQTAQVDVYIGGNKKNSTPISIAPGQRTFLRYGVNGGPVRVVSTNGVNIFASERTKFGNTFNEVMGYPANRLTTEYWFTSYDDAGMITYLVIGNPSISQTAQVDVYIGGVKKNNTPIQIAAGQRAFLRYGVNAGPVHVVSTNGVNIFASERSKYLSSFNEILGMAGNQLTTDYWFTSYDDLGMQTDLVIAAP